MMTITGPSYIHLNYPNDDEYGTSVSCVNVYLLHAVLLFTKQDKMKLLKSGCEGSDSIFFSGTIAPLNSDDSEICCEEECWVVTLLQCITVGK